MSGLSRRRFAAAGLVGAAAASLLELTRAASAEAVLAVSKPTPRYGLLVDAAACADGCSDCVQACNDEHGLHGTGNPDTDAQWLRKVHLRHRATGREVAMPLMCQHCADPPCVDVCPTGASFKRADGLVLVDKHICIGCRYCILACPYKARAFVHEPVTDQLPEAPRGKGTVESCTLCVHRIDARPSRAPACVAACNAAGHRAISFGNLADPHDPLAQRLRAEPSRELRADLGLGTGVRYQGI